MIIALFSDVHGRILLALKLCRRWEQETGEQIDLILQAGDLGAFPNMDRLDKASRRHAEKDPTELGFIEYFVEPCPMAEEVLADLQADLVFVRGNHEDHDFLDQQEERVSEEESIFPVDCYHRVFCLKGGTVYTYEKEGKILRVLGIGRVGDTNIEPKNIQPHEEERALSHPPDSCDILLTHDTARDFVTAGMGSQLIWLLVHELHPTYHFFGHIGQAVAAQQYPHCSTMAAKLENLRWMPREQATRLQDGAMGILRWEGPGRHAFEVVEAPWWRDYTIHSWKHL
jgi:Icc-related predicted phosphoesterase